MKQIELLDNIEAVIFDLDGTLLDSMWVWKAVDDDYLEKYSLVIPEHFHSDIEGKSYSETAQYFLDIFPVLTCTVEEIMAEWTELAYDKYIHEVQMKPGALAFIKHLHQSGKKLGIATSSTRVLVDPTLQALGIQHYFHAVRTSCEALKGKPEPDVYLQVAEKMAVSPDCCLVFEDVPMGILAGKRAGMMVCGVEDAFSRAQVAKKKELADYYMNSYEELLDGIYEVLV